MSRPIVNSIQIVEYLRLRAPQDPIIEVFDIYPVEVDNVRYGVYVDSVTMNIREPYQLGVQYGASIYTVTDVFSVLFVTFKNDPQGPDMEAAIQNMAQDSRFFDGYHEVDFTRDIVIGPRSERYTYNFEIKRLDFNT